MLPVLVLGVAWWLFADLAQVWGPSLITIFGQAASTPPELMGAYALGCVAAGGLLALLTRRVPLVWLGLALALAGRVVLQFGPGDTVQLIAASVGLAGALAWLAHAVSAHGRYLPAGLAAGWLATSTVAALGGTWAPVWRQDLLGTVVTAVLVAAALATALAVRNPSGAPGRRVALSAMPVALVAGIAVVNPGRASLIDVDAGPWLLVVGCATALLAATGLGRSPSRWGRLLVGVVAVAAVAVSLLLPPGSSELPMQLLGWIVPVLVVGPVALAVVLTEDRHPEEADPERTEPTEPTVGSTDSTDSTDGAVGDAAGVTESPASPAARPAALPAPWMFLLGTLVWVVVFFVYYAGYDLGYRADLVVVALAVLLVLCTAVRRPVVSGAAGSPLLVGLVLLCVVAAGAGAWHERVPHTVTRVADNELTVTAWNLRMGYGMDGRFDPEAVAEVLAGSDVVLLSEIDRGWLLNGGQDQLAILSRLTGKRLYFAPAADPVWGDAVLTTLPVTEVRRLQLPAHGAVTGAGALSVRIRVSGNPLWVVSTHVQPTTTVEDGTIGQAKVLAGLVEELGGDQQGVVLGGDLNFEPDSPSFAALTGAGLSDALVEERPVLTSPADDPAEEIDHLLVRGPWSVAESGAHESLASDHLPVWTRLVYHDKE